MVFKLTTNAFDRFINMSLLFFKKIYSNYADDLYDNKVVA